LQPDHLDQVAPAVHVTVEADGGLAVGLGRAHRGSTTIAKVRPEPVGVESLVAEQGAEGDALDERLHADAVVTLAGQQNEAHQIAEGIDQAKGAVWTGTRSAASLQPNSTRSHEPLRSRILDAALSPELHNGNERHRRHPGRESRIHCGRWDAVTVRIWKLPAMPPNRRGGFPVSMSARRACCGPAGLSRYAGKPVVPPWWAIAAVLVALATTACTWPDYTSVREWAGHANLVVGYPPATEPCQPPPGYVAAPRPPDPRGNGVRAMQEALATYLSALSTLAADGVLPYREDPFVELASRAAGASQAGARAVATLGALLRKATIDNARAPQLGGTISQADGSVQALVTALIAALSETDAGVAADRQAVAATYAALQRKARDPVARQVVRDAAALRDREFAARVAARDTYLDVLVQVAAGHALLKERASHLSQQETARQVCAAQDRLLRVAAPLPALLVVAPGGIACPSTPLSDLLQRAGGPSSSTSPR
jgi:hypothetical protein